MPMLAPSGRLKANRERLDAGSRTAPAIAAGDLVRGPARRILIHLHEQEAETVFRAVEMRNRRCGRTPRQPGGRARARSPILAALGDELDHRAMDPLALVQRHLVATARPRLEGGRYVGSFRASGLPTSVVAKFSRPPIDEFDCSK